MANETDKFWATVARDLARKAGLAPMTPAQAEKEFQALPDATLSEKEIDAIVEQVTSGELADWTPVSADDVPVGADAEMIEEDVFQLNRNPGESDPETDELLDELRRKALEDEASDGKEDSAGMDRDPEPPGQGD